MDGHTDGTGRDGAERSGMKRSGAERSGHVDGTADACLGVGSADAVVGVDHVLEVPFERHRLEPSQQSRRRHLCIDMCADMRADVRTDMCKVVSLLRRQQRKGRASMRPTGGSR